MRQGKVGVQEVRKEGRKEKVPDNFSSIKAFFNGQGAPFRKKMTKPIVVTSPYENKEEKEPFLRL